MAPLPSMGSKCVVSGILSEAGNGQSEAGERVGDAVASGDGGISVGREVVVSCGGMDVAVAGKIVGEVGGGTCPQLTSRTRAITETPIAGSKCSCFDRIMVIVTPHGSHATISPSATGRRAEPSVAAIQVVSLDWLSR